MPPKKITTDAPSTYLRLKNARTTILLLTSPLTPLSALVDELLDALRERYPDGLPTLSSSGGDDDATETLLPIPTTADEIELAVPADAYDTSAGWRAINWVEEGEGGLKGVGVPEGGVVAFRVRGDEGWGVEWPRYDDEEEEEEGMEGMEEDAGGKGKGREGGNGRDSEGGGGYGVAVEGEALVV